MGKINVKDPISFNEENRDDGVLFNGKLIEIYEPHGWFWIDAGYWIVYGHEEIVVLDHNGNVIVKEHTR